MSENNADKNTLAQGRNFIWHEVYGPSSSASVDFYTKALGFGVEEMPMGEMGTYKMLTRDGVAIAGALGTTEMPGMENIPPHWATYLRVENLDESLVTVQEHGASVHVPPMTVPNVGRMSLIADPQGAHLWLFEPDKNLD